jgi:predicted Zn-dependent protease
MCALVALLPLAAAQDVANELPDIGSPADEVITRSEEYSLGRMVVRGLRDQGRLLEDPEVTDYIQSLGSRIAAQAQEGGQSFQFFVVRDPSINAFALPGGFIGINHGLILASGNEAQLAGVLAHEIAHVTQRHIARSVRQQGRQGIATAAAIVAAILLGAASGSPDAIPAGIAVAQGAAAQAQINFTRANEYEADRVGIGFLANAGFDPDSMADFFETLGRRSGLGAGQVPEFLQTHPVTANRVAEARQRALALPRSIKPESESYAFIRERVRVLGMPVDGDLTPFYRARIGDRAPTPAETYGMSLLELQRGNARAAWPGLAEIGQHRLDMPLLQTSLASAQAAAGERGQALQTIATALRVSPRNVPLTVRYAELLLAADRAREAHLVLLDVFNVVAPTPAQIRLTALAASSAGDAGDAYYYMSEYHIAGGDLPLAVQQLELALAARGITPIQRQKYAARLKEIQDFLAENSRKRQKRKPANDNPSGSARTDAWYNAAP